MTKRSLSLGLLLVVGCGGGGNGGGGITPPRAHDLGEFWDAYLDALCELSLDCEAKSALYGLTELLACHPDTFARVLDQAFEGLDRAIAEGRVIWNEDEANRCLEAIRSVEGCTTDFAEVVAEACSHVVEGTIPTGGACEEDLECLRGNRCDVEAGCPGTCVALAGNGDACAWDDDCDTSLVCESNVCVAYSPIDGECREGSDCPSGICSSSTCIVPANDGEACDPDLFSGACAGSLVCSGGSDTEPGTCTTGVGVGGACGDYEPCQVGLRCANAVCVTLSGPGESCQSDFNCPIGFSCTGSRCEPLPTAGDACAADRPCLEGVCESGVCTLLAAGETCDPSGMEFLSLRQCAGYCDTDDVTGESTCQPLGGLAASCDTDMACGTGLECSAPDGAIEETCNEICGW